MSDQVWLSRREHAAMEAVVEAAFEVDRQRESYASCLVDLDERPSFEESTDVMAAEAALLGRLYVLRDLRAELSADGGVTSTGKGTTKFGATIMDEFGARSEREDPDYWGRRPPGDPRFFDPSPE